VSRGRSARAAALLLAALGIPACQENGSSGLLSAEVRSRVQRAVAPVGAVDAASRASGDAVVESGNPLSEAPSFSSAVTLTVDLAQPRYPGSYGVLNVAAAGEVSSNGGTGVADYKVDVAAATDLTFVDGVSGAIVTIPQGARWRYRLEIAWTWTDADQWTLTATASGSLRRFAFRLLDEGETIEGMLEEDRQEAWTRQESAGVLASSLHLGADCSVLWTDAGGTQAVSIKVVDVDAISISVDGTTFGPLTRLQLQVVFGVYWP